MLEPEARLNRRRTDTDGRGADRLAYRAIAEEAYRLYIADGCDRTRLLTYWEMAEKQVDRARPPSS